MGIPPANQTTFSDAGRNSTIDYIVPDTRLDPSNFAVGPQRDCQHLPLAVDLTAPAAPSGKHEGLRQRSKPLWFGQKEFSLVQGSLGNLRIPATDTADQIYSKIENIFKQFGRESRSERPSKGKDWVKFLTHSERLVLFSTLSHVIAYD